MNSWYVFSSAVRLNWVISEVAGKGQWTCFVTVRLTVIQWMKSTLTKSGQELQKRRMMNGTLQTLKNLFAGALEKGRSCSGNNRFTEHWVAMWCCCMNIQCFCPTAGNSPWLNIKYIVKCSSSDKIRNSRIERVNWGKALQKGNSDVYFLSLLIQLR